MEDYEERRKASTGARHCQRPSTYGEENLGLLINEERVSCVGGTLRSWGEMVCYEHQDPVEDRMQVWWMKVARSFGWQKWSPEVS